MKNVVFALVVLIGLTCPASAEILEPLGHACDEAWMREIKRNATVIHDATEDDVRTIAIMTKVHDRRATVGYRCRGDVVVWHAILFKHENERDAQDTFATERRGLTDALGRPCIDTTRPSSYLKRFADHFGLDAGTKGFKRRSGCFQVCFYQFSPFTQTR